jgi:arylsulfatase A-like enzyme
MATVSNVVGHSQTWESGKVAARTDAAIAARMKAYLYRPKDELYDLESDPEQLVNLAEEPAHAQRTADMRAQLRRWMEENADPELAEFDA